MKKNSSKTKKISHFKIFSPMLMKFLKSMNSSLIKMSETSCTNHFSLLSFTRNRIFHVSDTYPQRPFHYGESRKKTENFPLRKQPKICLRFFWGRLPIVDSKYFRSQTSMHHSKVSVFRISNQLCSYKPSSEFISAILGCKCLFKVRNMDCRFTVVKSCFTTSRNQCEHLSACT